jgi:hypothetical protein
MTRVLPAQVARAQDTAPTRLCRTRKEARALAYTRGTLGHREHGREGLETPANGLKQATTETPSLTVNGSEDVPVSYPKLALGVACTGENPRKCSESRRADSNRGPLHYE